MKRKLLREAAALLCLLLALFVCLSLFCAAALPFRDAYGAQWGQYLAERENSTDVMFFGSSITYCDVVPSVVWEESGLTSFVLAGPEQTVPISWHFIREALRTQSPRCILLEVTGVFFERYQNYTAANIGYMPWGAERLAATFDAAEPEARMGLLFPIYTYHSRWPELTAEDWRRAVTGYEPDPLAGYTCMGEIMPITESGLRGEADDAENYARNLSYLEKLAELCSRRGIRLVLFLAPTHWRLSEKHLEQLRTDLGVLPGAEYIDFNDSTDGMGLDNSEDYLDMLHFNFRGAEKFSRFLAGWLSEELTPAAEYDAALWESRAAAFERKKLELAS